MTKYLNPKKYLNFLINKIIGLLSPLIGLWERKYYHKYASMPLKHQPVFIIGAPRTGSTILYQTLTNEMDVLYIDNLICKFYKNIFFGFWLSHKAFRHKAHNCFQSNHGDTSRCGLRAPSECGAFWYRWLPTHKHFIDHDEITDTMVEQIRTEITTVINYFNRPILFKNLNAGQRLRLLQKCFPKAKFIFIKRDPIFTAQSIIKAKRKLKMHDNAFWSVMPPNVNQLKTMGSYEQIVKQIFYIEKQIVEDKTLFSEDGFLTIDYEDLGATFSETLKRCKTFVHANDRDSFEEPDITLTERLILDDREIQDFEQVINTLDWETYNDK